MKYISNYMKVSIILIFVCILFSCNKYYGCRTEHRPIIYVDIYNNQDTFSIGDTIWVEISSDFNFKDWETGNLDDFSNIDLNAYYNFREFIDTSINSVGQPIVNEKFTYVVEKGEMIDNKIINTKSGDRFELKAGFIALSNGLYGLMLDCFPVINNFFYDAQVIEIGNDGCIHTLRDIAFVINNGNSTLDIATKEGFRFYDSLAHPYQYWKDKNSTFYFVVE